MIAVNVSDDDDYDHFIYDNELYPKGTLTPKRPGRPTTPLIIIGPPPGRLTQGRARKINSRKSNQNITHKTNAD